MKKRAKVFENFVTNKIPHSSGVYNNNNIEQTNDLYDAFITGSDQVWNFTWYRPPFFLSFVNQKPKIAYAASIALEKLTQQQSELMVKHTKGYKAISIREAQGVKLLNNLNIEACNTADPTLLLGYNDYNKLCSERIIKDKYMYVYFLGKNPKSRRAAKEYAKQHGLKIVSAATLGDTKPADFKFADIKLEERVSPEDFLSLMKHAEFICTDSFHACVFSYIFKKQFAVFKREKNDDMSSRIINILNLLDENGRYCDTNKKSTAEYINSLPDIDYSKDFAKLNDLISFSKRFLTNALDSSAQGPAKA